MALSMAFHRWSPAINSNLSFLHDRILSLRHLTIRSLGGTKRMEKRIHRTLQNRAVTVKDLVMQGRDHLELNLVAGSHLLLVQDTTDYVFKREDAECLGYINQLSSGLRAHVCLGIDADSEMPLGFLQVQYLNRPSCKPQNRRSLQPENERESYRWIEMLEHAKSLHSPRLKTIIGDRESDIFLLFSQDRESDTHLLVRSCYNRKLTVGTCVAEFMSSQPAHSLVRVIPCGSHHSQTREAQFELRWSPVELVRPTKCRVKKDSVLVNCVDLMEVTPGVAEPVHWRIFTTHPVNGLQEALQIVDWYRSRWTIEELFRTTKKQGLQAEACQIELVSSLQNMLTMCLFVALRCLQLVRVRDGQSSPPIEANLMLEEQDIQLAEVLTKNMEGQTEKQKNPFPKGSLSRVAWLIARLGGWNGYKSDRPPGVITFSRGIRLFLQAKVGWKLALGLP
jgi:hypothetical protein